MYTALYSKMANAHWPLAPVANGHWPLLLYKSYTCYTHGVKAFQSYTALYTIYTAMQLYIAIYTLYNLYITPLVLRVSRIVWGVSEPQSSILAEFSAVKGM